MKAIKRTFSAVLALSALSASALLFLPGCAQPESGEDLETSFEDGEEEEDEEDLGEAQSELNEMNVAHCANVVGQNWSSAFHSKEAAIIAEINTRRAAGATCGGKVMPAAPALSLRASLRCAARKHSKDMVVNNYSGHDSLDGKKFTDRYKLAGYTSYSAAGENLKGYWPVDKSAKYIVDSWMNSAGHCEIVMTKKYKHVGVGHYSDGYMYRTTADFAAPP